MSPEYINALLNTWQTVAVIILGGVLAVIITHGLTIQRDRINGIKHRRREFLAFMESWKYEIGRLYRHQSSAGIERNESSFSGLISAFVLQAGLIKWDFPKNKRAEFNALCSTITSNQYPTICSEDDYQKTVKKFDAIVELVVND